MSRLKGIIWFWAAVLGIEALILGVALLVLAFSPVLRERVWESMLIPNSPLLRSIAANRLRHYPSKAAALSLVAMLNLQDKTGSGQDAAEEALTTLREVSGEPFQPGWEEGNALVVPTTAEAWRETVNLVNAWAFEKFGPDALASLARMGLAGNGNLTVSGPGGADYSFNVSAGSTAEPGDQSVSFPLPGGGELTVNFGDTAGLAGRLEEAGVRLDSRVAHDLMEGDTIDFREALTDMMDNVRNGDTTEAAVFFRFLGQPLPAPQPAAGATAAPETETAPGATAVTAPAPTEPSPGATAGAAFPLENSGSTTGEQDGSSEGAQ